MARQRQPFFTDAVIFEFSVWRDWEALCAQTSEWDWSDGNEGLRMLLLSRISILDSQQLPPLKKPEVFALSE